MTYQQFVDKYNNKGIDFDGFYGFQCMDLAHQYASECVGHDFAPAPAAKDVWNETIDGYDKIANSPDGVPQQGDIIIWGTAIGAYGHIAVFDHGDSNAFTSFDQNWPLNSVCHMQSHNYTGVLGWFHPKSSVAQPMANISQAELDQMRMDRDTNHNQAVNFQTQFNVAEAHITQLNQNIDTLTKKNQELQTNNSDLQIKVDSLSKQVGDLTQTNEELNKQLSTPSANPNPEIPVSTPDTQATDTAPVPQTPPNQPNHDVSQGSISAFLRWLLGLKKA